MVQNKKANISVLLNYWGLAVLEQGNYPDAQKYFEEAILISRELGNQPNLGGALANLGEVLLNQGYYARAHASLTESLQLLHEVNNVLAITQVLETFACLMHKVNQPQRAAVFFGAADASRGILDAPRTLHECSDYDSILAEINSALGTKRSEYELAIGRSMTLAQAVSMALQIPSIDNDTL